jgi:hypothetical protein
MNENEVYVIYGVGGICTLYCTEGNCKSRSLLGAELRLFEFY